MRGHRLVIEGQRRTRQILAGPRRIQESKPATGGVHTVFVAQELGAQRQPHLLGKVVDRPKAGGPDRGMPRTGEPLGAL